MITVQCDFLFFSPDVNFEELARCTDDFNGAQLKAVCVEAVSLIFYICFCLRCCFALFKTQWKYFVSGCPKIKTYIGSSIEIDFFKCEHAMKQSLYS